MVVAFYFRLILVQFFRRWVAISARPEQYNKIVYSLQFEIQLLDGYGIMSALVKLFDGLSVYMDKDKS